MEGKHVIENLFLSFVIIAREQVGTQNTQGMLARENASTQGTLVREHVSTQGTLTLEHVRHAI